MPAPSIDEIDVGDDLPEVEPDTSLENVSRFAKAARMTWGRFTDHEAARKEGLPGAIVPGIMSQGLLAAAVHRWAPGCEIEKIDTIFRAPVLVDQPATLRGVVTDVDQAGGRVEVDLTITNEAQEARVVGTVTVRLV